MAESLRNIIIKGVSWSAIDNVVQTGVTFVVSIVLARLLTPDDYGLIGIIAIFIAICTSLINGGFNTALIRKKDASDNDYCTAFICNLSISLVLYALIFFCSPLIAYFFGREELVALTRVASLGMIFGALSLVPQTRLTKLVDFKSQAKITLIASVSGGLVGIAMAFLGFGVWSLVAQLLVSQILSMILLWIVNKWNPSLRFSSESFHDLFGFGWKIMLSYLLNTIWQELSHVVVGKVYTSATLGQYTRSQQFSKLLSSNLTNVIQRVTYPVLSNIQDNKECMMIAYRKIIKTTIFITSISMFFLGAVSEPLLYCLIGPKWHDAAVYLPLICISGSTYPLHAINLNMLQLQGRSDLFLSLEVIKKIIAIGPLAIGVFVGIIPMLYAIILVNVIEFFLNSHYSGKYLGYSSWMQIKDVTPSYTLAIIIALSVYFLKYIPFSPWIILPVQIIMGVMIFFFFCKVAKMQEYQELEMMVKSYLNVIKLKEYFIAK